MDHCVMFLFLVVLVAIIGTNDKYVGDRYGRFRVRGLLNMIIGIVLVRVSGIVPCVLVYCCLYKCPFVHTTK